MKKLSLKVMTAAVAILTMLLSTVVSAETTTYKYKHNKEQGPVWFYMGNDGSGWKQQPKYYTNPDWGADFATWAFVNDPALEGVFANVDKSEEGVLQLHPDKNANGPIDVAGAWKAPADGKLTIPATTVKHSAENDPDDSKGTKVWIEYNGQKYDETALAYNGTAELAAVTLDVKSGDMVYFAADNNGRGGNNSTTWSTIELTFETSTASEATPEPTATPAPTTAPTTTTNPNPPTGDSGMAAYGIAVILSLAGIVTFIRRKQTNI